MPYSDGLRQLATVVELLEAAGTDVVDARPCEVAGHGDQFRVELRLDLPLESDLSLLAAPEDRSSTAAAAADREAGGTDEGENDADATPVAAAEDPPAPTTDAATGSGGDSTGDDSTDESDGGERMPCRAPGCDRDFAGEHGMKIHFSKIHVEDGADGPAYRDPDRLREAYAATDGFAAMREYLGADVSTETIRRYTIEHGIHDRDPALDSEDSGESDGAVPEPPAVDRAALTPAVERARGDPPTVPVPDAPADRPPELDEALPPGLTVPELKATVREADTLYQVAAELDLDRERARGLLRDLDLLDLVHGRVSTKRRRDELKSEIDRRLQRNVEGALSS